MEIRSIKTFILYNLVFLGINYLFIKIDFSKALVMSIISYFINYAFISFKK